MKVKIGDTTYDADDQPILVILSDRDKENIAQMPRRATKYCCYPDNWPESRAKDWMAT